MLLKELNGLRRLGLPVVRWGDSWRIKVRNSRTRRDVYIGSLTKQSNRQAVINYYRSRNISMAKLEKYIKHDFIYSRVEKRYNGKYIKTFTYEHLPTKELYKKLEDIMTTECSTFKVNVEVGFMLRENVD